MINDNAGWMLGIFPVFPLSNLQLVPCRYNLGGQGPKSFGHFFFNSFNASHFSVNDGLDKEDDLRFELKAWQLARQKVGQKIRKKVWDDMDVKGRSINGMQVSKK